MNKKYIKINNLNIAYISENDPQKPTILFLHGFQSSLLSMAQLFQKKRSFNIVAFDFPAHGDSDNQVLSLDLLLNTTNQFIEHFQLEKAILVGHSLGGVVALLNNKIKHKILLAPQSPYVFNYIKSEEIEKLIKPHNLDDASYSIEHLVSKSFKNTLYFSNIKRTAQSFLNHYLSKKEFYDPLINNYLINDKNLNELKQRISEINIYKNIKFISGKDDYFVPIQATKELAKTLDSEIITINGAGHSLIFESSNKILNQIELYIINNKL